MLELNTLPSAIQFVTVKWITDSLKAGHRWISARGSQAGEGGWRQQHRLTISPSKQ